MCTFPRIVVLKDFWENLFAYRWIRNNRGTVEERGTIEGQKNANRFTSVALQSEALPWNVCLLAVCCKGRL